MTILSCLAAAFTFTASATGVGKGSTVEFLFIGSDSDRDYEAMFTIDMPIADFAKAVEKAGLKPGMPIDPPKCQVWPVGTPVAFEPEISRFVCVDASDGFSLGRVVYTGGLRGSDGAPGAATYATEDARFLIVEPGVPKSSRTLSLLRERFIKDGAKLVAPCPHYEECPMSGFKAYTGSKHKWCNFAFSTESAPKKLLKLSTNAKLPKERATLSFISIVNGTAGQIDDAPEALPQTQSVRIISDSFRLPNYMQGFYGCSDMGLVLLSLPDSNNTRLPKPPFVPKSGDLLQIDTGVKKITPDSLPKDEKSGAIIFKL